MRLTNLANFWCPTLSLDHPLTTNGNPLLLALSFILHFEIKVIVFSKLLEPRLALTKNGDPYYLVKETEKKIKTQEDVTNTQEEKFKARNKKFQKQEKKTKVKHNK